MEKRNTLMALDFLKKNNIIKYHQLLTHEIMNAGSF